jgi:excisionase family DNA binding protein
MNNGHHPALGRQNGRRFAPAESPEAGGFEATATIERVVDSHNAARFLSIREAPAGAQEAARFLNMHSKTVLRKARSGALPAHPVGGNRKRWHFYLSELDDWLRSQVNTCSHPPRAIEGTSLPRPAQP